MTNTLHNKIISKYSTIKPYPSWVIFSWLGLGFITLTGLVIVAIVLIALFIWDVGELNSWYGGANIIEMSMYEIVGFALICGIFSYILLRYLLQNEVVKYRFALIFGVFAGLLAGGWFLAFLVEATALPSSNFETIRSFIHTNYYRKPRVDWLMSQSNTLGVYTGKVASIEADTSGKYQYVKLELLQPDTTFLQLQSQPSQLTRIDVGDIVIVKAKVIDEKLVVTNIKKTSLRSQMMTSNQR